MDEINDSGSSAGGGFSIEGEEAPETPPGSGQDPGENAEEKCNDATTLAKITLDTSVFASVVESNYFLLSPQYFSRDPDRSQAGSWALPPRRY